MIYVRKSALLFVCLYFVLFLWLGCCNENFISNLVKLWIKNSQCTNISYGRHIYASTYYNRAWRWQIFIKYMAQDLSSIACVKCTLIAQQWNSCRVSLEISVFAIRPNFKSPTVIPSIGFNLALFLYAKNLTKFCISDIIVFWFVKLYLVNQSFIYMST